MTMDKCKVKGCRNDGIFDYEGHRICWRCWERHLDKNYTFNLRTEFNIRSAKLTPDEIVDIQAELNEIIERGKLW